MLPCIPAGSHRVCLVSESTQSSTSAAVPFAKHDSCSLVFSSSMGVVFHREVWSGEEATSHLHGQTLPPFSCIRDDHAGVRGRSACPSIHLPLRRRRVLAPSLVGLFLRPLVLAFMRGR